MKKIILLFLSFIFISLPSFSQEKGDSIPAIPKSTALKPAEFIIPGLLVSYGLLTRVNGGLLKLDHSTGEEVKENISKHFPIDDYLQFLPSVSVYGLKLAGLKTAHSYSDITLVMGTSFVLMESTVQIMKYSFHVERPDNSNNHSFPSGHTAFAFMGAYIAYREYKDSSPLVYVGAYADALATGALRVINKKHWVSDVITGAGIGTLSAQFGYMLLPVWKRLFHSKMKNKSFAAFPIADTQHAGLGLVYVF